MISNLALIDNQNARALGFKMMELPYVVDIRFFPTLKGEVKDIAGENALNFTAVTFHEDEWRRVLIIAPEAMYNDETQHQILVDRMAEKIKLVCEDKAEDQISLIPSIIIPETPIEPTTPTE
jgi:hypothetical protein